MRKRIWMGWLLLVVWPLAGCGGNQPKFPDLVPVTGVVKSGGNPVKGGVVTFETEPNDPSFLINSEVGSDGTFALSTVRTTDSSGQRKKGAPAGSYKVVYAPPLGDQVSGGHMDPVTLANPVTVSAGNASMTIELPAKK